MTRIEFEKHAPIEQFEVRDGQLLINGMALSLLAGQAEGRPFYAYDRGVMARRVEALRDAMPERLHLHYAMKANPMPAVVDFMARQVDGLDVASLAEMRVALNTPTRPADISFAGPGKDVHELREAVAAGIVLNVESFTELDRLTDIAQQTGGRPKVAVRVNPDFQLKSSGMKMGGGSQQFGVDAEQVPEMLDRIGQRDLEFIGFHIYSGSQNLRAEALCEAQSLTFSLAERLAALAPGPLRSVNIGGGLGVPYFPGDTPLDLKPLGEHLAPLMARFERAHPTAQIIMELGRFLVAEAGVYVCRVLDRKISRDKCFLVTNGGLHHHLAASGNFGQIIRKNYPVAIGNRLDDTRRETASVVGPLCTPLDLLADSMPLAPAQIGDLVVVFVSGAYGYTASPRSFLSHPEPGQFFV